MNRLPRRTLVAALLGLALGAGALVSLADPPKAGFSPDPQPLASRKQWTLTIAVRRGKPGIEQAQAAMLDKPVESPRLLGRFALELYVGPQLLDRVRFNVPMLGDGPPERSPKVSFHGPPLDNVTTTLKVRMADNPRAAYLLLVDRLTGESQRFEWPPEKDGRVLPWKTGWLAEAGPDDFPEGGVRVTKPLGDAGRD